MAHRVERVGERPVGVRVLGRAERRLGGGEGLAEAPLQHRGLGLAGEDPRALRGAVVLRQQLDRAVERLARVGGAPERPLRARQQLEQVGRPARLGVVVDVVDRDPQQRLRAPVGAVADERAARAAQQAVAVAARLRGGVGHPRPQLERALEQRARLAVGVHALGGVGGADGGHERLALRAGLQVVVRDAGGDQRVLAGLRGLVLERARQRQVQLRVLAGEQVVVDDLAQQRVAELVAAALVGDDHVRLRRLAQRGADLGGVEPARLGEHGVGEHAPGREHPQHLLRRLAEPLDPHHQRVAQRARQPAATVEPRGEQLLGEQRVALAARVQALEQLGVGRAAEDVGEQVAELLARQPRELDPARARVALELGEQRAQRVAAVQLVGAVGGDHQHPLGPQAAREEDEEGARRAVGPVDVLQHERERLLAAELVEQREQRLEQLRLAVRAAAGRCGPRRRAPAAAWRARRARCRAARRARGRRRARACGGR